MNLRRWAEYQRERFPLLGHCPLIAAFSVSAVCFSSHLRGVHTFPPWGMIAAAFASSFFFFLQLRIADEFKDLEEDARYRPYRPVPRGLVTLRELAVVAGAGCAAQLALAVSLNPRQVALLCGVWLYLAMMTQEFFARRWLKSHPFTYMWTHMLIMPLVDMYATAWDWVPAGAQPPTGLGWFLAASFFNGVVIEIGRKIRAPGDEEEGVQTYTVIWGCRGAVAGWLAALALTGGCGVFAARTVGIAVPFAVLAGAFLVAAALQGLRFAAAPARSAAKRFELISGVWTLAMYLALGLGPFLLFI